MPIPVVSTWSPSTLASEALCWDRGLFSAQRSLFFKGTARGASSVRRQLVGEREFQFELIVFEPAHVAAMESGDASGGEQAEARA